VTRRVTALVLISGALALGACGGTDRPEGVVERWLISLNQGEAGEPERYAPKELSSQILPPPREPNDLDVIEVGKGRVAAGTALVPYRVEVLDGPRLDGIAQLQRLIQRVVDGEPRTTDLGWQITGLLPADPALRVPSEGGERIGGASAALWLGGVGSAGVLILLTWALMAAFGREFPGPRPGG